MPLRDGYWFSTNTFKLIEVYEHLQFLSELEGKVRNELGLTKAEKGFAKELGMATGTGWGLVRGEKPAERRERFLREAMKRGWVRVRAHGGGGVYTFEADRLDENTLASLPLAVRQLSLGPGDRLELHGVSDHKAMSLSLEELAQYAAGERPAAVGYSVWENPVGNPRSKVKFHQRGCPREFKAYANPAGDFHTKYTGHFHALEGARLYGKLHRNPAELSEYVDTAKGEGRSVGRFFVGLTRGVGKKRGQPVPMEHVVDFVSATRRDQLPKGLRGGATFITQRGFFTEWKTHKEHPEEDSLQILIYPEFEGGEDLTSFESNMRDMAALLTERFDQRAVVLDLEIDGKLKFLGEAKQ